MIKIFQYFVLFLFIQTLFHIVMGIINPGAYGVSQYCLLNTCLDTTNTPIFASIVRFYWVLLFVLFLLLMVYDSFLAIIGCSVIAFLTAVFFGNFDGVALDVLVIFGIMLMVTPFAYFKYKQQVTHDGLRLAPLISLSAFVCTFPIAWLIRPWLTDVSVSKEWEFGLVVGSVLSIPAFVFLIVALFSTPKDPPNRSNRTSINSKESQKTNYSILIISGVYLISLFFGKELITSINPVTSIFHVILFWVIIYPVFRKKVGWYKNLILIVYLIVFQLALDSTIYYSIIMFLESGEYIVILTDYVIALIYLALFPLFKTLPEYLFLRVSEQKSFLAVLRNNFANELLILLFIIIKMNLVFYSV